MGEAASTTLILRTLIVRKLCGAAREVGPGEAGNAGYGRRLIAGGWN